MSSSLSLPLVIGAGGAGNFLAERVAAVVPCHGLAINTDAEALQASGLEETLFIHAPGKPRPATSAQAMFATRLNQELIRAALERYATLVIAVGLGGASGSGIALTVAEIASAMGQRVIVAATLPFAFETRRRAASIALMGSLRGLGELVLIDLEQTQDELKQHASLADYFDHQAVALTQRVQQSLARTPSC